MGSESKTLAVLGHPLAPKVADIANSWLSQLQKPVHVEAVEHESAAVYAAIAYISSPEGINTELLQTVLVNNLAPNGTAVIPVAKEDAWLLAAFLKGQGIKAFTYGLGNAELVLHPDRALPNGLGVTLKYNTLQSSFTLPIEDESELLIIAAALALLVAAGIDLLDLLPILTTSQP